MKSDETKERIIHKAIELIESKEGDIEKITIRRIAEQAGVGVGLINHYFGTKDNLIEVCVQRIIQEVVYNYDSGISALNEDGKRSTEVLKYTAKYVMNFLFEHPQVSYISILGDFKMPQLKDNSMGTVYGFAHCMSNDSITENHLKKAFELVAMMQAAFIKKDILKEVCKIDLNDKIERDNYIDSLVDMVMGGE